MSDILRKKPLKTLYFLAIILFTVIYLLTGCSSNNFSSGQSTDSYPLKIIDDSQTTVTIPSKPQRIISFLPSTTEILFALEQGDRVIAVTQWDNYPPDIKSKVEYIFSDALNPNLEQIINLKPDLIFLGPVSENIIANIRDLGIPVIVTNPQSLSDTYETILQIGTITDSQEQASNLVSLMKEKEKAIESKLLSVKEEEKPRVWLEVSSDLYTPGNNTFLNELITKAGGKNIARNLDGWGQFNSEQVIAQNPQVILVTYGYYDKNAVKNIKTRPGWQNLDAVKNNRVIELDNDIISRPGPRIIDGLELIAKALYPDIF